VDKITFEPWPKIPRAKGNKIIITEKIDGTNAQVIITDSGEIGCASRNRLISVDDDNYGFAAWVQENKEELLKLGPGRHFGEWWGKDIQRGYGLEERRFSLFNTLRWHPGNPNLPACCHVIPILFQGNNGYEMVDHVMLSLSMEGSKASPGFMEPEGVVLFSLQSNSMTKYTFETPDGKWKEVA